ncbi:variable large family protein [Borrelia crocidurae]|nr:variable large family protein [Borrelia crocidurae]
MMMMVVMMVMGCNSGGVKDPEKLFLSEMVNLGRGFLDVFVSFGDMITGTLGIKAETKKSEIGAYFTKVENTMKIVKEKLQAEIAKRGNYEKIKAVVDKFITDILDRIAVGANEAAKGAAGEFVLGGAVVNQDGEPAESASVDALVKGIRQIVEVVLEDKGSAGTNKTGSTEQQSIGKLLGQKTNGGTEQQAAAAGASVGAVSGADILQAISKSGNAIKKAIDQVTNAAEIAVANKEDNKDLGDLARKDAVIAAGIALRAMAKGGKFAAKQDESKSAHAINGVAANAVSKTLSTLIIAIRNSVDSGLKKINEVLATVKQEDKSSEATVSGQ